MRGRARGTTLLELLSYSALLIMLFGMVYSVLALSLRYYHNAEDAGGLQNEAMVALNRVLGELSGTPARAVRADANGIVFLSARTADGRLRYDSDGNLLWQEVVCYYRDTANGRGVLRRKERAMTPTATVPTTLPTVADLRGDASLPSTIVARDIASLTVTPGYPTDLRITASSDRFAGATVELSGGFGFRQ